MAEINVEKKSNFPWWIWLVVALIIIALLFFLLGGDNQADTGTRDDTHTRPGMQDDTQTRPGTRDDQTRPGTRDQDQTRPGTTEPGTDRRQPGATSEISPIIPEYQFTKADKRYVSFVELS